MNLKTKLFLIVLLTFNIALFAQNSTLIKGTVVSIADNIPVAGVNVIVLNTSRGVTTDFDGKYQIQASKGEVLQFSSLGYVSQTRIVGDQATINISLVEDLAQLDEVVVVGYGVQKKKEVTGAVAVVDAEAIAKLNLFQSSGFSIILKSNSNFSLSSDTH